MWSCNRMSLMTHSRRLLNFSKPDFGAECTKMCDCTTALRLVLKAIVETIHNWLSYLSRLQSSTSSLRPAHTHALRAVLVHCTSRALPC